MSDLIWGVLWGAELGWAWRIQQLELRRKFPFLFGYLAISAIHSVLSTWVITAEGYASGWFWAVTYPVLWVLMEDSVPRSALIQRPPRLRIKGKRSRIARIPSRGAKKLTYTV